MEHHETQRSHRMDRADSVISKLFTVLTWFSILAAMYIMIMTFVNVFTRAFLSKPIFGIIDTSQLAMPIVALCALPIVTMFNTHIKVDLVADRLPQKVQDVLAIVNLVLCAAIMVAMSYYTFLKAAKVKTLGTMTASLSIPFYPVYYLIAVMMLVSALCAIYNIIHFAVSGTTVNVNTFSRLKSRKKSEEGGVQHGTDN